MNPVIRPFPEVLYPREMSESEKRSVRKEKARSRRMNQRAKQKADFERKMAAMLDKLIRMKKP